MEVLIAFGLIAGLSHSGVSGRAVNISSAWFLPQEGFPVFYRYFNDKVTWNEAEAVCNFHHADLLSVETSGQMDAARAYLKEIDVTDNIWIGLRKESPEKPFSWTNTEKLLGDGYWTEPIPKTNEKLCAAIDPVADFRWNSFYCRGPQLASFVCELPVPEWAKRGNGCLITSLPSLTVTLIPEVGVIQLLSDCGLDGTRRIACNADVNREEIIKRLSCDVDAFASTTFGRPTTAESVSQQNHWSDASNHVHRYETTKTYSAHTRHRRSVKPVAAHTANSLFREATSTPLKNAEVTAAPTSNPRSRAFVHSTQLIPARNVQSTGKPPTVNGNLRKLTEGNSSGVKESSPSPSASNPPAGGSAPAYEDLPVLVITGEKFDEPVPSATSENTPIVLMIENKDLDEPFLVPLSDDIFVDPSLSPVEVINVDLIEVGNLTANGTGDRPISVVSPGAPAAASSPNPMDGSAKPIGSLMLSKFESEDTTEESLNAVEEKGAETPQKPNRGRLLTHPNHPSFYPRFLNRVLG